MNGQLPLEDPDEAEDMTPPEKPEGENPSLPQDEQGMFRLFQQFLEWLKGNNAAEGKNSSVIFRLRSFQLSYGKEEKHEKNREGQSIHSAERADQANPAADHDDQQGNHCRLTAGHT